MQSWELEKELQERPLKVRVIFDWKNKNEQMNLRFYEEVGPQGLPKQIREKYHNQLTDLGWEYKPDSDHYVKETSPGALEGLQEHFDVYVYRKYKGYVPLEECERYVRVTETMGKYKIPDRKIAVLFLDEKAGTYRGRHYDEDKIKKMKILLKYDVDFKMAEHRVSDLSIEETREVAQQLKNDGDMSLDEAIREWKK